MSPPRRPRPPCGYPLAALAEAANLELHRPGGTHDGAGHDGRAALADRLSISIRWTCNLIRWGLTHDEADRYANAIGRHPATIWPTWAHGTYPDGTDAWDPEDPAGHSDEPPAATCRTRRTKTAA